MVIVFTLVYTLVPRNSIFAGDDGYRKLAAKPDDKTDYMYNIWQKLGYLNFVRSADYFQELYDMDSPQMTEALKPGSKVTVTFKAQVNDAAILYGKTMENYTFLSSSKHSYHIAGCLKLSIPILPDID